jgi:hypothetical protein
MRFVVGIKEVNSHVKCMVNPDVEAYTDFCECIYGYLGWNCLDECPGLIEVGWRRCTVFVSPIRV